MEDLLGMLSSLFQFFEEFEIAGMSLVTWFVIMLIISGVGFIIRGNK